MADMLRFSDRILIFFSFLQAWFQSSQPMTRSRSSELRYHVFLKNCEEFIHSVTVLCSLIFYSFILFNIEIHCPLFSHLDNIHEGKEKDQIICFTEYWNLMFSFYLGRRKYAAMQNCQTSIGIEAMMHNLAGNGVNNFKQEYTDPNEFNNVGMSQIPNQQNTFMSPSNSSSSTFNAPQAGNADNISSVVSMLKGTLERKKLQNPVDREAIEDCSFGYYGSEDVLANTGLNQVQSNHIYEIQGSFQNISNVQVTEAGVLQTLEGSYGIGLESIITPTNPLLMSTVSREPSQSESSAAAPVVSTGFDVCDGPSISSQVPSVCKSSRKQVGRNLENTSRCKGTKSMA